MNALFVFISFLLGPVATEKFVLTDVNLIPETNVQVGEIISLPYDAKSEYFLNQKAFTVIPSKNKQFAVAPISRPYKNILAKITRKASGVFFVERQILTLSSPNKDYAAQLRLPTSVWKKVNNQEQIEEDGEILKSLYYRKDAMPLSLACLHRPLNSKMVSDFASPRSLPNGTSYLHTGMDLRAFHPTPVKSAGYGKVIFSQHLLVPGNIVVIDHGGGIYSRYMHLSKSDVEADEIVQPGQVIGLSGQTGRVEAPHLHWEIIWKGSPTNPDHFLKWWEQICDPT